MIMAKQETEDFLKTGKGLVYFVGIGGISMSGLAEFLLSRGFRVAGSDRASSPLTEHLEALGANIFLTQEARNLDRFPIDLLVYTAAIPGDHPELTHARELNIPAIPRAELLGAVMALFSTSIAVAGTHGKTTTTSMLSEILMASETDPTIALGGILPSIGGNFRVGGEGYFLAEACEYKNSFLSFAPTIGIILNIDADHLDFFKDLADIRASFRKFAANIPPRGTLIVSTDVPEIDQFAENLPCSLITVGEGGDYEAFDISYDEYGCASFSVKSKGHEVRSCTIHVPGAHNVKNALAAIAASDVLGLSDAAVQEGLSRFHGTNRRFQKKGEVPCEGGSFTVIDDYAHHPTEIAATIAAAKRYPHRKLWIAFQPHTYSRTKALLTEFADALAAADHVVLADIYAARETDNLGISSADLAREISARGTDCHHISGFPEIEKFLRKNCMHNDLCITMGAGNIEDVGDHLVSQ